MATIQVLSTLPPYRWRASLIGDYCPALDNTTEFVVDWIGTGLPPQWWTSGSEIFVSRRDDGADSPGVLVAYCKVIDKSGTVVWSSNEIYLTITSDTYYA